MENKQEIKLGRTLFIVTTEFSPTATETLEQKLLRIMGRHALEAELSESYQNSAETSLL